MKLNVCLLTKEVASTSPDESSPQSLTAAVNLLRNKGTQQPPNPTNYCWEKRVLQPERLLLHKSKKAGRHKNNSQPERGGVCPAGRTLLLWPLSAGSLQSLPTGLVTERQAEQRCLHASCSSYRSSVVSAEQAGWGWASCSASGLFSPNAGFLLTASFYLLSQRHADIRPVQFLNTLPAENSWVFYCLVRAPKH